MNSRKYFGSFVWGIVGFFLISLCCPLGAMGPQRVASLLPSHSEIVVVLDAGDSLVGVSDAERADAFPSALRVGGLVPRWEVLVALTPDLILADSAHEKFQSDFERFHLPVRFFPATHVKSIEDVFDLIESLGNVLDRKSEAEVLLARLRSELASLDAGVPRDSRPRVFFEIWPRPLQGVGPVSLQGHLLSRAGFENIVPETRNEMPLLSSEWVAGARPDVILHTGITSREQIVARAGWKQIPAVQRGQVIAVNQDLFSRAGPGIVDALAELHRIRLDVKP
ncbi:MAG: ABC transporter substrate-binding protein [Elusimicrobia bacterium]|nr:ABC transporter substrate-binding protein [Elusimicrobiota bacterium]